jgi:hypothetical protein
MDSASSIRGRRGVPACCAQSNGVRFQQPLTVQERGIGMSPVLWQRTKSA